MKPSVGVEGQARASTEAASAWQHRASAAKTGGVRGDAVQSRRAPLAVIAVAILAAVAVLFLWSARGRIDPPPPGPAPASAATSVAVGAAPLAPAPLPPPKGAPAIRGQVRGPAGPVAGAVVTATTARGEDVLSERRCHCGNDCGQKLLECGCGEAAGQLLELVARRRGETQPVARATTGADGRFALEGLAEGSYGVWAESSAGAAVVQGVRAGADAVVLEVDGGVSIAGRVVDGDGEGIGGAVVTAIFAPHSRFFDALSGVDGSFSFGPLPAGPYTVVALSSGLLPARARVERGDGRNVRLELAAPRQLAGRVTLGGVPAAGATVTLRGEHRRADARTVADGAFAFQALRPGEYELVATLDDRVAQGSVSLPRRRDVRDVTLALAAGVTVDGAVVDETGAPVAAARVTVEQLAPRRRGRIATVKTDASGTFRVGPVEPGELELSATREGYVPAADPDVRVSAVQSRTVRIVLQRARRLEGTVVDPDGRPIAGAEVVARSRDAGAEEGGEALERSGPDGAFALDVRGGSYVVEASHPDFRRGSVPAEAPARRIVVTLARGARVEGEVLGEDGKPVAGATVGLLPERAEAADGFRRISDAVTDGRGRFRLAGLEAGTFYVTARRSASALGPSAHARVEVPADGVASVSLRFEAGLALSGTVVGPDGAPVAGARVWARGVARPRADAGMGELLAAASQGEAESDRAGRFSIRGLRPGEHEVVAGKEGLVQPVPPPRFRAGDADVSVVLSRRAFVRGRVVGDGGAPLPSARVNGKPGEDGDGRFAVPIAIDGSLTLLFSADGYAPLERAVEVRRGADLDLGDVSLGRGREVTGVVADAATGAPVPGAQVGVARDEFRVGVLDLHERSATVVTGVDGAFTVHNAPDRSQLRVEAQGYAPVTVPIPAAPGPLRVALGRGGSIAVRVLRGAGEPMARVDVAAFTREGTHREGRTDADGRWEAKALPPGRYVVFVNADRSNPGLAGRWVDVADGARASVELRELLAGTALTVVLSGPGISADDEAHVALVRGDLPPLTAGADLVALGVPIEPTGRRPALTPTFQPLEPGRYTLIVGKQAPPGGLAVLTRPVDVGAGPQQRLDVHVPADLPVVKW